MAACLSDCHISNLSCLDSSLGEILQPICDSWREISTPPQDPFGQPDAVMATVKISSKLEKYPIQRGQIYVSIH